MTQKNIYSFTTTKEQETLREIKTHARTVLTHELGPHIGKHDMDKNIQKCLEHYYIPIDIWYNFNPNNVTPTIIKEFFIHKIINYINNGIYDLPKGIRI